MPNETTSSSSSNHPSSPKTPISRKLGTGMIRSLIGWMMLAVVVISVVAWFMTNRYRPTQLRFATAESGGLYHKFGTELRPYLVEETGLDDDQVVIVETEGSKENRNRLLTDQPDLKVDVAILQGGSVNLDGIAVVAPLYHEYVHVIVRRGSAITQMTDLVGKSVVLGRPNSGMLRSASVLLEHYRIDPDSINTNPDAYFTDILENDAIDAAIVTTGAMNPDLQRVLGTGDFDLIPIEDAEAIAMRHFAFAAVHIPRGLYCERPAIPAREMSTIAATSLLAVHKDAPEQLVGSLLKALYDNRWRMEVTHVFAPQDAAGWSMLPVHPMTARYFDPYGGIGIIANFMESIAAIKELLFALGAGAYLAWELWRRMQAREQQAVFSAQKERLDDLLSQTVTIERAQTTTKDPVQLKSYLDDVTSIKLEALEELTHEDLRGDRMFSIFLMQCGNLIRKIQTKIGESIEREMLEQQQQQHHHHDKQ